MKSLIIAAFAGSLALASVATFAADQPAGETRTERAGEYVKDKTNKAKKKTKRAGKKVKRAVKDRTNNDANAPK